MRFNKANIDFDLITGLKQDDHKSFQRLFERYSQPLYQFSLSYLKSKEDAEGVVQEAFIKIWKKRKELKEDTSFKAYLFTIALNLIRKGFNKQSQQQKIKHDILFDLSQNKPEFDDNDNYQVLLTKLEELIQQMPEKRRQVFVKKKLEEKSLKEISEELFITSKTVEYHIAEAMKFLKQEFAELREKGITFFYLFLPKSKI